MVVPTAAGGGNDVLARIVGQKMGELLGQTVVVVNSRARRAPSPRNMWPGRRPMATP